jgi:hypothetical protein
MKKNHLRQAESLLGHFAPVDLDCAYLIAYALGHQDTDVFLIGGEAYSIAVTNIRQIYAGTATGRPANRVRIRFYGGPVGRGKWYDGTVYSFIVDCVSAKIQMEGFEKVRQLLNQQRQLAAPPF